MKLTANRRLSTAASSSKQLERSAGLGALAVGEEQGVGRLAEVVGEGELAVGGEAEQSQTFADCAGAEDVFGRQRWEDIRDHVVWELGRRRGLFSAPLSLLPRPLTDGGACATAGDLFPSFLFDFEIVRNGNRRVGQGWRP